jgi:aldehyde dehydrogenase (NAD+)
MAVIPYDGDDEAVKIANDSNYGLGASAPARSASTTTSSTWARPFGGMKDSRLGRELGPEALNSYLEYKSIYGSANLTNG